MASLVGSVTVDRNHFDSSVPRTNFNGASSVAENSTVIVSRIEYFQLKKFSQQYANLCRNLTIGGISKETIELLSSDGEDSVTRDANDGAQEIDHEDDPVRANGYRHAAGGDSNFGSGQLRQQAYPGSTSNRPPSSRGWDETQYNGYALGGLSGNGNGHQVVEDNKPTMLHEPRRVLEHSCMRSIQITNLSEATTLSDIASVIRGGQVLELYLRHHDRVAAVSFVYSSDAEAFFEHVRRHDLCIKDKYVTLRWSERQFVLPSHLSKKISNGATRNLMVYRCNPNITEDIIREDLDHIHNLVVLGVEFSKGNCLIKLNSVHNAMYARTCMMSRAKYKGSRIDWAFDECSQPIEKVVHVTTPKKGKKATAKKTTIANRFQLLNLDVDGDESNDSNASNEEDGNDSEASDDFFPSTLRRPRN